MNVETEEAWIDDIVLEIVTLEDYFPKAIARYEYPYADGADLEDLGQRAHTIKVRCYFFDNAGQSTYDEHRVLVNHLAKRSHFEFTHPKYGIMWGKIENIVVRHDDRKRTAEVDVDFVEQMRGSVEPIEIGVVEATMERVFTQSVEEQQALLIRDLQPLSTSPSALQRVQSALNRFNAMVTDVTQPVNSLIATISYGTSLPGRFLGAIDRAVERVARLHDGIVQFPSRFQNSVDFGLKRIESDLDSLGEDSYGTKKLAVKHLALARARRLALETSYLYGADRQARLVQQGQRDNASFDTLGRYTPRETPEVQPMNVLELESTLSAARSSLQEAIDHGRALQSLREMALALEQSVAGVKNGAERVVTIQVDGSIPLHLLCLSYGLPYGDAQRLLALNPKVRNPSFVSGEVRIYA